MKCRFCDKTLTHEFIDLVNAPPSNSFLTQDRLNEPETFYPLKLFVCDSCFLVQVDEYKKSSDIFDANYAYFSSFSTTWLAHCKNYTDMMIARFGFGPKSRVIEIASNDGYLLQYFKQRGVPCLGIEPTASTAAAAREKGIETLMDFFGTRLAKSLADQDLKADLLLGNNVLAHVPDLNDFVAGLKIALKPTGIITMEFPHLMQLVDQCLFDTIYHEHFSYFSFRTVHAVFKYHNLEMFDIEDVPTHGGSLRIFAKHAEDTALPVSLNVKARLDKESARGLGTLDYYKNFQARADKIKRDLLQFLIEKKETGLKVAAYGAAAKGNTCLNYCGVRKDLIDFVVDASPHKQGMCLPGSHIPIVSEESIKKHKPDFVVILPWNIKAEIREQLAYIRQWGGKFVTAIPALEIF